MVADHHEAAVAARVKVVHCCGYDSIPSDLGAQAVAEYIRSTLDRCDSLYIFNLSVLIARALSFIDLISRIDSLYR